MDGEEDAHRRVARHERGAASVDALDRARLERAGARRERRSFGPQLRALLPNAPPVGSVGVYGRRELCRGAYAVAAQYLGLTRG